MASPANAALCALLASAFWTFLGYGVGRHLLPRSLALSASPVLGWAVHSAALLPIVVWTGFSPLIVGLIGVGCIALATFSLSRPAPASRAEPMLTVPSWAFALAAILAVVPAVAILPKFSGDAAYVADPIFDHAKIAIVDAMARLGLPPINPVFSESGVPDRLPYYYLWHFSAAAVALTLGTSGWEADIGLTWFSAFASLALMMGLAVWLSQRSRAATWVVVFAAAGSLWSALDWAVRAGDLSPFLWPPVGMGGWLFQATWVPQHLMAASCSVTSAAARHSLRAAAKLGPFADAGLGCCRRLRKLCLRRRYRVCARRHCGGACPVRGNMPGRAVASRGRAGDRRIARRLLYHAVRFRSADRVARARRWQSDRRCPLRRIWRAVSELAAASRGHTRLLVDHPADRIAGRLFRRARRVDGGAAKRPPAGRKARCRCTGVPCRHRPCDFVAAGQHLQRQQRSRPACDHSRRNHPDRECGNRADDDAPSRRDHRDGAGRARAQLAGHCENHPRQCRRQAKAGRQSLRASTRTLGDSASIRDAGRPRRQQSAVSQRPDTVAGEFVLGLACQPQLVFCRHRTRDPFCSAAAKAP